MSTIVQPLPTERLVVNIGPSHPVTHGTQIGRASCRERV